MLRELLINNVWVAIGVVALIYTSDYVLTLVCARMYEAGAKKHFVFHGGYELTPYLRTDVARLRWFGHRFIIALVVLCFSVWGPPQSGRTAGGFWICHRRIHFS